MSISPRLASALGFGLAIVMGACDAPSAPNSTASGLAVRDSRETADFNRTIASMRAATAKYHDIGVARADGYVDDGFGCVADPTLGGMGWHLIHDPLHADPAIDPLRPELLIYEPKKNGGMQLVAVEYEVYQQDWWDAGNTVPPSLLGKEFEALTFEGIDPVFGLHVWLWRPNSAGMLEDFNPAVTCP
ncbi:MAG: hypothetical protein ABI556_16575 [Gemmatimonadales bacterium]